MTEDEAHKSLQGKMEALKSAIKALAFPQDPLEPLKNAVNGFEQAIQEGQEKVRATSAQLPDPKVFMQETLQEAMDNNVPALPDDLKQAVNELAELPGQLQGQATEINNQIDALQSEFQSLVSQKDRFQEVQESVTEQAGSLFAAGEKLLEHITDDLPDRLETLAELSLEGFQQHLHERVEDMLNSSGELIAGAQQEIEDVASALLEKVEQSAKALLDTARQRGEQEVQNFIDKEGRDFASDMIGETLEQINADMIITQIGTQVTAALTPQLPQLIVAKNVVEQVRHLLELKRSGGL